MVIIRYGDTRKRQTTEVSTEKPSRMAEDEKHSKKSLSTAPVRANVTLEISYPNSGFQPNHSEMVVRL